MLCIKTYLENYPKAKRMILDLREYDVKDQIIGYSWLQRRLKIGFMEACQIHDKLIADGLIHKVENHFVISEAKNENIRH